MLVLEVMLVIGTFTFAWMAAASALARFA